MCCLINSIIINYYLHKLVYQYSICVKSVLLNSHCAHQHGALALLRLNSFVFILAYPVILTSMDESMTSRTRENISLINVIFYRLSLCLLLNVNNLSHSLKLKEKLYFFYIKG